MLCVTINLILWCLYMIKWVEQWRHSSFHRVWSEWQCMARIARNSVRWEQCYCVGPAEPNRIEQNGIKLNRVESQSSYLPTLPRTSTKVCLYYNLCVCRVHIFICIWFTIIYEWNMDFWFYNFSSSIYPTKIYKAPLMSSSGSLSHRDHSNIMTFFILNVQTFTHIVSVQW